MASPRLLSSSTSASSDLTSQSCHFPPPNRAIKNDPSLDGSNFDGNTRGLGAITLEEFLCRMGVVGVGAEEDDDDSKVPEMAGIGGLHDFMGAHIPVPQGEGSSSGSSFWVGSGGGGKRRAVVEPGDKVAQQRQRRMIKNRESAARSRERKQAYTMELESLVAQLEEENSRLQKEQASRNWERYKQLVKNLIPVEEKPQSRHVLSRARSAHW